MKTIDIARELVETLENKKAENILLMDIHEVAPFADYFIICSGTSDRMLGALAKEVQDKAKELFGKKTAIEGYAESGWMIVDLDDIVIHMFSPDQRDYYQLEQLWNQGKILLHVQ